MPQRFDSEPWAPDPGFDLDYCYGMREAVRRPWAWHRDDRNNHRDPNPNERSQGKWGKARIYLRRSLQADVPIPPISMDAMAVQSKACEQRAACVQ